MTQPTDQGWDRLVAAATVGTDTKKVDLQLLPDLLGQPAGRLDDTDQARLLLDVAALYSTARRAGQQSVPAPSSPTAAAIPDEQPALTSDAARILTLLAQRSAVLLTDALRVIGRHGFRLPEPLLPDFLTAAGRGVELRAVTAALLGRRGRWLAAQNEAWSWVAEHADDGATDSPEVWRTGTLDERRRWFAQARRRDPAAARAVLVEGWATEAPDDRAPLLQLLGPDLTMDDEPFLEAALDDRRAAVREVARDLLAQLPESRWSRRMAERAGAAVRVEQRLLSRRLRIRLPSECDAAMHRDGITAVPPPGTTVGARAWWLQQIVAGAPLSSWPVPAAQLLGLTAVDDDGASYAGELRAGWQDAAVRQRSADWAQVLLGSRPPPADQRSTAAELLGVLAAPERSALVTAWLPVSDLTLLELVPDREPWPTELAAAVLHRLQRLTPAEQLSSVRAVPLLARRLPVERNADAANTLYGLASSPTADNRWRRVLTEAAEVVLLRRRLLEELT